MSVKIPHSLTEIVKKLKEWNQKEAAWVFSFPLPLRTYKYKCGKAEDDVLKCLDHLKKFSKGTAETPFKHSQAKTLCTEGYNWFRREKDYWVSPCLLPFALHIRAIAKNFLHVHICRKDRPISQQRCLSRSKSIMKPAAASRKSRLRSGHGQAAIVKLCIHRYVGFCLAMPRNLN